MKNLIFTTVILLSGCVAPAVENAIDTADSHIRLKWSEEWKPALIAEVKSSVDNVKTDLTNQMTDKLAAYNDKLEKIGVDMSKFDADSSGRLEAKELIPLFQEIKAKNDKSENPMPFWEIMLAVGATYLPLTGAKEMLLKKGSNANKG